MHNKQQDLFHSIYVRNRLCYSNAFTHLTAENLNPNPAFSASPFAQQRNAVPQTNVSHLIPDVGPQTSLANSETNDKQAPCCLQPVPACTSRVRRKTCVNISPEKPCVAVRLSYFPASNTFCSGKVILFLLPCSKCAWGSWFFFPFLTFP